MKRHEIKTPSTPDAQHRTHTASGYEAVSFADIPRQVAQRETPVAQAFHPSADALPLPPTLATASHLASEATLGAEQTGVEILMGGQPHAGHAPAHHHAQNPGAHAQAAADGVVQRLAVQIELNEPAVVGMVIGSDPLPDLRISSINIVGRPERLFGNSMGDHTTAFSVHQKGILLALKGKTIADATAHINGLVVGSKNLPGMEADAIEQSGRKDKLNALEAEITRLGGLISPAPNGPHAILHLQRMVATYLEFREQIPFSAMNIALINQGLAGKGKGEAGPSSLLLAEESSDVAVNTAGALEEAILGLLDIGGLALAMTEPNRELATGVLPGTKKEDDPFKIAEQVLTQHWMSIKTAFPKALDRAGLGDFKTFQPKAVALLRPKSIERAKVNLAHTRKARRIKDVIIKQGMNDTYLSLTGKGKGIASTSEIFKIGGPMYNPKVLSREKIQNDIVNPENLSWTKSLPANDQKRVNKLIEKISADLQEISLLEEEITYSKKFAQDSGDEKEEIVGPMIGADPIIKEEEAEEEVEAEEAEEEEDAKQPIATELELDGFGRIRGFLSGGRTPSPFQGSMGAHSTAWVVHLDEIRNSLKGKTPSEAFVVMDGLAQKAFRRKKNLFDDFTLVEDEDEKPNPTTIFNRHTDLLKSAKALLQAYRTDGPPAKAVLQIPKLQSYINALLTYINFIPGSTFNSVNVNGRAEGKNRAVLMAYENSQDDAKVNAQQIFRSIGALLDLPEDLPGALKGKLYDLHLHSIQVAYPKSFKLYDESTRRSRVNKKTINKGRKNQMAHSKTKRSKQEDLSDEEE